MGNCTALAQMMKLPIIVNAAAKAETEGGLAAKIQMENAWLYIIATYIGSVCVGYTDQVS